MVMMVVVMVVVVARNSRSSTWSFQWCQCPFSRVEDRNRGGALCTDYRGEIVLSFVVMMVTERR
jgi:hypothetical protein